MQAALSWIGSGSKSLSYFLGLTVIALAVSAGWTRLGTQDIAEWALQVFGVSFLALFGALVFAGLFCWTRLRETAGDPAARRLWADSGLHAANGVSTLALTYTLLGISLGIGTLAHQDLTPETIQGIIRSLTEHFSMAFMTTVVGLPSAAILRALIGITATRLDGPELLPPEPMTAAAHAASATTER